MISKRIYYLIEFPSCVRVNEVLAGPTIYLDVTKKVFKTYSADFCAQSGREEAYEFHAKDKRIIWSWYSATTECVIYVSNDDPSMQMDHIQSGKLYDIV